MALLHYFMASVDKLLSPVTQREAGIKAAHLYFTLNEIPGKLQEFLYSGQRE